MKSGKSERHPRVTVLTPTFNRAHVLPRLYASLVAQTIDDFEWLVVDDGSSDGTGRLIDELRADAPFEINYTWQENAGKHVALNTGMAQVRTPLTAMMDSDDWYEPEALEHLLRHWDAIAHDEATRFANVEGRCVLPDGTPVTAPLESETLDIDYYEAVTQRGMDGDTCGIWRTDVLAAFPFPEDLGPFVSEELVFNRIANRYTTRYCNEVVAVRDYQPGGLTDSLSDARTLIESAPARLVAARELLGYGRPMPIRTRVRAHANEIRSARHLGHGLLRQWRDTPRRLGWAATLPLGLALSVRDRMRARRAA